MAESIARGDAEAEAVSRSDEIGGGRSGAVRAAPFVAQVGVGALKVAIRREHDGQQRPARHPVG